MCYEGSHQPVRNCLTLHRSRFFFPFSGWNGTCLMAQYVPVVVAVELVCLLFIWLPVHSSGSFLVRGSLPWLSPSVFPRRSCYWGVTPPTCERVLIIFGVVDGGSMVCERLAPFHWLPVDSPVIFSFCLSMPPLLLVKGFRFLPRQREGGRADHRRHRPRPLPPRHQVGTIQKLTVMLTVISQSS